MQLTLDFEKKLEDFRLRVAYEGEASRIGILGASGCGKSMTLRSIAGNRDPGPRPDQTRRPGSF